MIPIDKKRLIVDFDNVLVDSTQAIVDLYNEDFQYYKDFKKIRGCDVGSYGFHELTLATKAYLNQLWNQPRFFHILKLMPYAREVLEILSIQYDIEVATLGDPANLKQKSYFINDKFPNLIKKTHLINFEEYQEKSHIDMSDAIFIDDLPRNLTTSNAEQKFLFGDNFSTETSDFIRLSNWHEVLKELFHLDNESMHEVFVLLSKCVNETGRRYAVYCGANKRLEQFREYTRWSRIIRQKVFQMIFDMIPDMSDEDMTKALLFVVDKLDNIHTAVESHNETAIYRTLQFAVDDLYAKFIKTTKI